MDKGNRKEGRVGSPSYSMGKLYVYERKTYRPPHVPAEDPDAGYCICHVKPEECFQFLSLLSETRKGFFDLPV